MSKKTTVRLGRPRTSSAEKRREDANERQRRRRAKLAAQGHQVTITVPTNVLVELDAEAKRRGLSRADMAAERLVRMQSSAPSAAVPPKRDNRPCEISSSDVKHLVKASMRLVELSRKTRWQQSKRTGLAEGRVSHSDLQLIAAGLHMALPIADEFAELSEQLLRMER